MYDNETEDKDRGIQIEEGPAVTGPSEGEQPVAPLDSQVDAPEPVAPADAPVINVGEEQLAEQAAAADAENKDEDGKSEDKAADKAADKEDDS